MIFGKIAIGIIILAAVLVIQLYTWWLHDSADIKDNNLGIMLWIMFSVICAFAFTYILILKGIV